MRRGRLVLGVAVLGLALAGCGDDEPVAASSTLAKVSPGGVYAAVIRSLLQPVPLDGEAKDRHVYVVARGAGVKISLEIQANVVQRLEHEAKVQWVDDPDEALLGDEDGAGVRGDGIVVGLGPVPEAPPPVRVYADRATRRGEVDAFLSTVTLKGEEWAVVSQTTTEPQADLRE